MFDVGFVGWRRVSDRFWLIFVRALCSMLVSLVGGVFRIFCSSCSMLASLVGGVFRTVFG